MKNPPSLVKDAVPPQFLFIFCDSGGRPLDLRHQTEEEKWAKSRKR
jgi:hypothetical protein